MTNPKKTTVDVNNSSELLNTENSASALNSTAPSELSNSDLLKRIENAESSEAKEFIPLNNFEVLELVDGETINCAFVGFETMKTKTGKEYTAVKLLFSDGKIKLNADKVLVSTMTKWSTDNAGLTPVVRVICKGLKAGANGEYKDLEIYIF